MNLRTEEKLRSKKIDAAHLALPKGSNANVRTHDTEAIGHNNKINKPYSPDTDLADEITAEDGTVPNKEDTEKNSISPPHLDDSDENGRSS